MFFRPSQFLNQIFTFLALLSNSSGYFCHIEIHRLCHHGLWVEMRKLEEHGFSLSNWLHLDACLSDFSVSQITHMLFQYSISCAQKVDGRCTYGPGALCQKLYAVLLWSGRVIASILYKPFFLFINYSLSFVAWLLELSLGFLFSQ